MNSRKEDGINIIGVTEGVADVVVLVRGVVGKYECSNSNCLGW